MQVRRYAPSGRVSRSDSLVMSVSLILAGVSATDLAQAQESPPGATSVLMEEVTVTARKREELVQDVPLSVSAFDADQLEALKVRDLESLAVNMPNVALDDIGTFPGTANFSIRGLGINSSIPSIDPTVGIFIDGVYMGNNLGVILDTFELENIQVLRGPQGTLFGRNVTGGAVLVNTSKPGDSFEFSIKGAMDSNPNGDGGLNRYVTASVGGPLTDTFAAKVSVYNNTDDGWFENELDGDDFGETDTTTVRPVFVWNPTDALEMVLRYEYTESDGQGPAGQSHTNGSGLPGNPVNFDRDSHRFSIDERGVADFDVNFLSWETNWDVGNGTLTNIFGWRDLDMFNCSDIDAQPIPVFHVAAQTESEQYSNELRYTGEFDNFDLTTGINYLTNDIKYSERRELLGVLLLGTPRAGQPFMTQDGGGDYQVETSAVFGEMDYHLTDALSLIAGLRFTRRQRKSISLPSLATSIVPAMSPRAAAPSTSATTRAGTPCRAGWVSSTTCPTRAWPMRTCLMVSARVGTICAIPRPIQSTSVRVPLTRKSSTTSKSATRASSVVAAGSMPRCSTTSSTTCSARSTCPTRPQAWCRSSAIPPIPRFSASSSTACTPSASARCYWPRLAG